MLSNLFVGPDGKRFCRFCFWLFVSYKHVKLLSTKEILNKCIFQCINISAVLGSTFPCLIYWQIGCNWLTCPIDSFLWGNFNYKVYASPSDFLKVLRERNCKRIPPIKSRNMPRNATPFLCKSVVQSRN